MPLPQPVLDYLSDLTIRRRSPACLLVSKQGRLVSWHNTLDYGLYGLKPDMAITERAWFLEGMLPLEDDPVVLPCVFTTSHWPAEIHLFPGKEGDWIIMLDSKVEERQRVLLQQRAGELALLQERQAELIQELDAFAHTVAHDLKGPLTGIMGFTELLRTQFDDLSREKRERFLDQVVQSGTRMNRIIHELLLLAGVRKQKVELRPVDMAAVVREALNRLDYMIRDRNAAVTVPDTWPAALGHAPWVEEVWANYISNAVKYGGDPPSVELGAEVQPNGLVRFWVRDNGPGLSEEDQARLFKPHTRLDEVRAKGHGLGLSIVQRIVRRLGGEVGVSSRVNEGSAFSFTLRSAPEAQYSEASGSAHQDP
ncbi:MAG: HAMP domain-containing histidine kinase [candidate division WOR-3 bacterium]|nr:MAG: HAMP domain-containing histidine kinase [candidate division WOR-3 bacterium]